ncbi:hypothetical protein QBC40DRAFT_328434 [Triangularia verruculosa]|uniref:Uncharacterized protein n=1 Tax=Triangularia verruculosa TaxID=2587418 RepID=A0AAN6XFB2_9PEZI|nr:hypothetical protein QBC40DRAFT_328434 [Triangularia verruculosa]
MDSNPGTTSAQTDIIVQPDTIPQPHDAAQPDTTNDAQTGATTVPPTGAASPPGNISAPAQTTAPATPTDPTVTPTANVVPSGQQTTTAGAHPGPAASQGESPVPLSTTAAVQSGSSQSREDDPPQESVEEAVSKAKQSTHSSHSAPSTTSLARRQEINELRAPAGRGQWKIYELPEPYFGPLAPVKPKLLVLLITGGPTVATFHSNEVGRDGYIDKLLDSVMTFQVGSTTVLPIRPSIAIFPGLDQKVVPVSKLHLKADHVLQEKEIKPFIAATARVTHDDPGIEQLCSHLWRIQQNLRFRTEEGNAREGYLRATSRYFDSTLPYVLRIFFHPEESQHQFWLPKLELGYAQMFHNPDLVGGKGPIDTPGWRQKPLCDLYVPEEFMELQKLAADEMGGDVDGSVKTFRWMTRTTADTMTPLADSLRHPPDEELELALEGKPDPDPSTQESVNRLPGWDPKGKQPLS